MADALDDDIARELSVLDDLEVPDLWERAVTLADTERVVSHGPRRRWPVLAVAAAVLAVVAVGLTALIRDDGGDEDRASSPSQLPAAGSDENVARIDIATGAVGVTGTITAGWVSFEVVNDTDGIRTFEVRPLLPGRSYDDVAAALPSIEDGASEPLAGVTPDDPAVGGFTTGRSEHVVHVPLPAGDYVVVSIGLDGDLQYVPDTARSAPLRVDPGDGGQPPTPTLTYQIMGDTVIGDTSTRAGRATITLEGDGDRPHELLVADVRDGANQSDWDRWSPWTLPPEPADWDHAPVDSLIGLWGSAPGRALTVDLDPGLMVVMGGPELEQMVYRSIAYVQVD